MGKVEIDNFWCLSADIYFFFTEMFLEESSTSHMNFVEIAQFD